jgi:hypothetical protein
MHIKNLICMAILMASATLGHATDQSPPPMDLPVGRDAEAAHQVEADQDQVRRDWRLDPAIFTDISPVNAPAVAIKLPEDQREDE